MMVPTCVWISWDHSSRRRSSWNQRNGSVCWRLKSTKPLSKTFSICHVTWSSSFSSRRQHSCCQSPHSPWHSSRAKVNCEVLFFDSIFTHDPFQAFISSSVFRSKFRATIVLRLSSQAILRRAPLINCRVLLMKFSFRFYRTPRTTTDGQKCKGLFINYVNHLGGEGGQKLVWIVTDHGQFIWSLTRGGGSKDQRAHLSTWRILWTVPSKWHFDLEAL